MGRYRAFCVSIYESLESMKSPGLLEHPVSNNISYIIIQLKQTVLLCNSHWLVKELAYISLCNVGHAVKNLGHSWRTETGQIIQGKEFSSTLSSKCNHKQVNTCASVMKPQNTKEESLSKYAIR